MTDHITITHDSQAVLTALNQLLQTVSPSGMRPAYAEIGERITESTKQRFVSSTAPDGSRWAPNAPATYLSYLAGRDNPKKLQRKDGRINKKGAALAANKRPLIDSGDLAGGIHWQIVEGGVMVGTDRFSGLWEGGAAVFHYGRKDGHIPARPFLGISTADEATILDVINRHLTDAHNRLLMIR